MRVWKAQNEFASDFLLRQQKQFALRQYTTKLIMGPGQEADDMKAIQVIISHEDISPCSVFVVIYGPPRSTLAASGIMDYKIWFKQRLIVSGM